MEIVTKETKKMRENLYSLQKKLDYLHGEKYDLLSLEIDHLVNEINIKENKQIDLYNSKLKAKFDYEIFGGANGNYQICLKDNATRIAFVRRNQKGGGYTVSLANESKSIQMRSMPVNDQANEIMKLLQ